jgi:hypothetical protein
MGWKTDLKIQAFQEQAGIKPASPKQTEALNAISTLGARLISICALERSGIRDGDGAWHGSDPLRGTIQNIQKIFSSTDWMS